MHLAEQALSLTRSVIGRASTEAFAAGALFRSGAIGIDPPQRLLRALNGLRAYGPAGAALVLAAQRHPDQVGLIDDRGSLTFAELDQRSNRIGNALLARDFEPSGGIGILCRNHRGMLDALFTGAKLGARTLLLNTDFSGPQLAEVCRRENVQLVIHDQEFTALLDGISTEVRRIVTWADEEAPARLSRRDGELSLDELASVGTPQPPPKPQRPQQLVLLTSGTTGTPKGAPREFGMSLAIPGGYLSKIPYRTGRRVLIAAPVFHAWGLLSTMIALGLGNTIILQRVFEPPAVLDALAEQSCDALITVPILLSRLLAVGKADIKRRDLSALRIIGLSGSALSAELAADATDAFGEVLYNLYGSTEVAYASIATPEDLRAAPGCVGKAPRGTTIKLLDDDGVEVSPGETGRIFVGNSIQFAGYTGGGSKEQIAGLMSTGDLGHLDPAGRLFVDGRDDDMIISGGENVFPAEIEGLLSAHEQILEAAVTGVDDPDFGQRLRAYVVRADGASIDAEGVRSYVKSELARYKVPRDVEFVDELPRNPAGKVVKTRLQPS